MASSFVQILTSVDIPVVNKSEKAAYNAASQKAEGAGSNGGILSSSSSSSSMGMGTSSAGGAGGKKNQQVRIRDNLIHSAGSGYGGSSGSNAADHSHNAPAEVAAKEGVLCLMGSVTKKLVITPAHDIGVRRSRAYSANAAAAKAAIPTTLYGGEEEEIVMMDE